MLAASGRTQVAAGRAAGVRDRGLLRRWAAGVVRLPGRQRVPSLQDICLPVFLRHGSGGAWVRIVPALGCVGDVRVPLTSTAPAFGAELRKTLGGLLEQKWGKNAGQAGGIHISQRTDIKNSFMGNNLRGSLKRDIKKYIRVPLIWQCRFNT